MSNNTQLKAGALLSYAQMVVAVLVNLLYTPTMIHLLGKSEYGLYNTVISMISTLSILSLGFNSSYIRYFAKYKQKREAEAIAKLNGLFLILFSVIGLLSMCCGVFLVFHLRLIFQNGLSEDEYYIARILTLLLTINLSISFPMSVFNNIVFAHERFIVLKELGILRTVLGPMLTLPLLLMGYRSIAMVAITVLVALITDVLYLYYVFHILKVKFIFRGWEKGLFRSLFVYTSFIAINIIVDQINVNLDKILLGRYQGTTAVALYSVGFTLYISYVMLSTSISDVFTPRIHQIINETTHALKKRRKMLTDLFIKVGRIQFAILALVASGFFFFGKTFIVKYWAGFGYDTAYYVGLLLIFPATIALIQNVGIEIQRAENLHQFRSVVYLVMAFLNFSLSIYLCQRYGAIGSAIGTAVSLLLANGFVMNIYYHKRCNINILAFWRAILSLCKGLICPVIFGIALMNWIVADNIMIFIILILSYTLVYMISMWFGGINQYEKDTVLHIIHRIIGKMTHAQNS